MNRKTTSPDTFGTSYGNFERITRKAPTEGFTGRKGAKLNKRDRKAGREQKRGKAMTESFRQMYRTDPRSARMVYVD